MLPNNEEHLRYLRVLARQFPTVAAAASEIIRIEAITRLPKGTEHFMSDLHGENEAFLHILNSASGVIREKIDLVLGEGVPAAERAELATLIYYPAQKLPELKARQADLEGWYRKTLLRLIELCRQVSSKHTRAHVRRCLPQSCAYILDELLHAHFEDHDKDLYYGQIIDSILRYDRADAYVIRFCEVIKHLAVDRLHILGDLFDRGPRPDLILDQLMAHHDVDIQWGNHDVVWMGAASGSPVCIFTVLKTSLAYGNLDLLETGYGISLRGLERFAVEFYPGPQHPRWEPHLDPRQTAALTPREEELVAELVRAFTQSERLQRHVRYLYARGAVYKVTNGNLLFHGAVPMTADGDFARETFEGQAYSGRALFDYCDRRARAGYFAPPGSAARLAGQDFLWYLWCGALSPIYGRSAMTTFERLYIADKAAHAERKNPYYALVSGPGAAAVAERILAEFGLSGEGCHILNGHVPVRAVEGEDPVKAGGRLVVIDGGFCRAYHRRTGIAGYTLVYNSRGLTLRTHQPFESTEAAIRDDEDIDSQSAYIYTAPHRILVRDTDEGRDLQQMIGDLSRLVDAYRTGLLPEQPGG